MFDICLHTGQGSEAIDWFIELKKEFNSKGISVIAFTLNEELGKAWQGKGMYDFIVLPEYKGEINIPEAAEFAKSLGISNFRSLYQTPQVFYDLSEEFCQRKMACYIHALQGLKDVPKAKIYWTYGGDEFDHNCLRLLSRMHNGKTIYSQSANIKGRMVIFKNEDRYWKIPSNSIPEPEEEEVEWIKNYIVEYTKAKTILWGNPKDRDIKWEWNYPIRFLKRIRRSQKLKNENPESTNSYKLKTYFLRTYNRFFSKQYYSNSTPYTSGKEDFVYFPLHYPKDSQLTLRGKPFMDQASIIETVARYVPYPYTLVVKEHPHARGWYKTSDIKKMASLPNVKLIHPFTNSHEIIPNAKGIIAINSSVGYEGIIYRKPVITMGRSFYRNCGVTIDVNSLYELEQAFERMESFSLTNDDIINFLWRMKYFSYPVVSYFDRSPENRALIVKAAEHYLKTNNILG